MNPIDWLLHSQVVIAGSAVLVREIVGNGFGLASALFGMRRRVAAWPIGIVGNVLLFTVFVGGVFDTPQDKDLWGQAGRQVFFAIISVYGWYRWYQTRHHGATTGVQPRWATTRERLELLGIAVVLYAIAYVVLPRTGLVGSAVGRVDPDRLDPGDVRDGARIRRVLADLDRSGRGRRTAAGAGEVLPVGGDVRRLRTVLRARLRVLVEDPEPRARRSTPEPVVVG